MHNLLIIDDDPSLTELLSKYLNHQGYDVRCAADGVKGMQVFHNHQPDLIILDITMPHRNGWETLNMIRDTSDVPVILLTAHSDEPEILRGFSHGADDYVTKPFSFAQLAARVQAVLSRSEKNKITDQNIIRRGDLTVDIRTRQVWRGSQRILLTPTEFKLLVTLMCRSGEVISRDELVRDVWGIEYAGEVGHVRRYIWHLRQKIETDPDNPIYIHNERGFGYRFQAG